MSFIRKQLAACFSLVASETCLDMQEIPCDPKPCPLGYYCPEGDDESYCRIEEGSCHKYCSECNGDDEQNLYNKAYWKPSCGADGKWLAKQCKGGPNTGRLAGCNALKKTGFETSQNPSMFSDVSVTTMLETGSSARPGLKTPQT